MLLSDGASDRRAQRNCVALHVDPCTIGVYRGSSLMDRVIFESQALKQSTCTACDVDDCGCVARSLATFKRFGGSCGAPRRAPYLEGS